MIIPTTSSSQRRVFSRVIPKQCAEPRTQEPLSSLTTSPNASPHCIQFDLEPVKQHGSKSAATYPVQSDEDEGWNIVIKTKRGKTPSNGFSLHLKVDASVKSTFDPTVAPFIPEHMKTPTMSASTFPMTDLKPITKEVTIADGPEDDSYDTDYTSSTDGQCERAHAFHVSGPHRVSMPANKKDSYAAPKVRNMKYTDESTFKVSRGYSTAPTIVRKYQGRRQQAKRISAEQAKKNRCLDLFGPNLSHRKQAPDVLFYAPSERIDTADKARVADKQLFTPRGWPINKAMRKCGNAPVFTGEAKLCAYHKKEREDKLWKDHKDHYKDSYKAHKVTDPGAYGGTYPMKKAKPPVKIRQVEHFDKEFNSIVQPCGHVHILQTEWGQALDRELKGLTSEIAQIVLDADPLSRQRPVNPMSSLLQGLVRKGIATGVISSTTITRLWIRSGGKAEDAPIPFEMIARERAGISNRYTKVSHSGSKDWGKPRVNLRHARYRGQAPVVRGSIRPTISADTKDAFHRLIVGHERVNQGKMMHHHRAYSVTHEEGGEEEHKDDVSESEESRHEYDSDYQQSEAVDLPEDEGRGLEVPAATFATPQSPSTFARTASTRLSAFINRQISTPAQVVLQGHLNRLGRRQLSDVPAYVRSGVRDERLEVETVTSDEDDAESHHSDFAEPAYQPSPPSTSKRIKTVLIVEPPDPPPQQCSADIMTAVSRYYRHNFGTPIPANMPLPEQVKLYNSFSQGFLNQFGLKKLPALSPPVKAPQPSPSPYNFAPPLNHVSHAPVPTVPVVTIAPPVKPTKSKRKSKRHGESDGESSYRSDASSA